MELSLSLLRASRLVIALCIALLAVDIARADPIGSLTGRVVAVTGASIDVGANRQIVHFILPSPFFAVYLADKTRAALTDITPGMTVRVEYSSGPTGQQTAREIDILGN